MLDPSKWLAPLRHKNYRLLFFSFVISMVGDGVWLVSIPWITIGLGGDNSDLAMVVGAESIGLISCVLIGGTLADRYPRKAVIGWSFAVSFVVLSALAAIHASGHLAVWHLVITAFALGASAAISGPTSDAFIPDLMPEKDLHAANALESIVRSLSVRIAGPAVGGVLISLFSPLPVIIFNALSFLIALGCLWMIIPLHTANGQDEDETAEPVPYRRALTYLFGERWLWMLILWSGVVLLLQTGPRQVLLPFVIHNDLRGDARDYGILLAVFGVSAMVGSLVVASQQPPWNYPQWMLIAWTVGAAPLTLMIFASSFWMLLPLGAVYGFFSSVGNVYWFTLVQTLVPEKMRGRIISIDWLGSLALVPLSMALAGLSSSQHFIFWFFVLGGTVPVLLTLVTVRYTDLRALSSSLQLRSSASTN